MNRSRVTGNLSSHGNIFVDIANDRVGIGSTIPTHKVDLDGTFKLRDSSGYDNHITFTQNTASIQFPTGPLANLAKTPYLGFGSRTSGGDFKIYHDHYNAHLKLVGLGGLVLSNNTGTIGINGANGSGGVRTSLAIPAGATEGIKLYHGHPGSLKFETVGYGVTVHGTTETQGLNVTGVATATTFSGSGASLTNLNGSNIASGTVPVARIGTGTKNTTTFYRGDGTFATVTPPAITAINSASNNRVVTSDGGTTVTAESTLTFSDRLTVNVTPNQKILLQGSTHPYIHFYENTTGKAFMQWHADGYIRIKNDEDGSVVRIKDSIDFSSDNESSFHSIWHAGNDGSGSGLDSDTVDGIQASSFLRSDVNDASAPQRIEFSANNTYNYDTIATSSGSQGCIEIFNDGVGNDAFMAFHTGSDFAFYFGLDGDTNKLAVGGWSMGANKYAIYHEGNNPTFSQLGITASSINALGINADTLDGIQAAKFLTSYSSSYTGGWEDSNRNFRVTTGGDAAGLVFHESDGTFAFQVYGDGSAYGFLDANWGGWDIRKYINGELYIRIDSGNTDHKVWCAGNDGSGSGLDADTLDGYGSNSSAAANSIALRTSGGNIFADHFHTTSSDTGTGGDVTRFYCSQDDYIRYIDKGSMRAVMNVSARSSAYGGRESDTTDQNYWIGSCGYSNNNFDSTVWDFGSCFFDVWNNPSGQPSGTSHWTGVQAMHYTNGSSRYGMRITCGAGNPDKLFVQGRWGTTTNGWHKLWNAANDGSGSGLDADTLDGMQPTGLFSTSYTQTAQLSLRVHTNSWNGGIKFISADGNNTAQLHMDNDSTYDLMIDSLLYVGGGLRSNGDVYPNTNDARDLGTSSLRWRNVYTTDLQLSNESKKDEGGNDVDGTWGDFTMQEGEDDLFLINNRSGKKYKFNLTEVS